MTTTIAEIAERDGLLEGDQEELHGAMLADGPVPGPASDGPDGPNVLRRLRAGTTRTMASVTPFDRLGRFVVRRAWWVVGAWVVLLLAGAPARAAGARAAERRRVHPRRPRVGAGQGAPRDRARRRRRPPSSSSSRSPTLEAGHARRSSPRRPAPSRDVPTAPHVARVVSHLLSPRQVSADRHTAYDIVFLDLPPDDSPEALPILRERLHDAPGLTVELAGGPAFYGDVQAVSEADLRRSELISLPLAALALLFVFGSLVAAGVPLVVGGAAVVVALAAIFLVASVTPMSIFVLNLATLLGLGLGVDYSLLMTSRFREELALRPDGPDRVGEAVRVTVATAGRAVFFSGLTVLLGLLGLVLFEFMILRSVGIAGAIVVGLAVLAALTLLPAVLTILGARIDRFAVRKVGATPRPPTGRGPGSPAGSCATRSPSSSRRSASCSSWARRSCTSGSTRRTRRSCRRTCRRAPPSTGCRRIRRGRVRAARAGGPDDRAGHRPGRTSRPCTTTRAASPRTRGSPASTAWSTSTRG